MGEFGDKFRKAREKKGISLDDVSNVTKISSRNLQAIEEEHFDQLPGGVFNKGFIRAYARHVGLDGEQAVNEYLACLRQAQIDAQAVWEPENRAAVTEKRPLVASTKKSIEKSSDSKKQGPVQLEELPGLQLPRAEDVRPPRRDYAQARASRISWRFAVGLALVLVVGVALWQRHARGARAEGNEESRPFVAPPSVPVEPPAAAQSSRSEPAHAVTSAALKQPAPTAPQQSAKSSPAVSTTPKPAPTGQDDDVSVIPSADVSRALSPSPAANFTLVIRATENSWISIAADGQIVTQETLIAPAHTTIHADREIIAKIGNAAGVSFLWNGQEIPTEGAESEVRTYVFDASGMRVLPAVQPPAQNQNH